MMFSSIQEWKMEKVLCRDSCMMCDDLKQIIGDAYKLEDYIIDRLEFSYKHISGKRETRNIFELAMMMY